MRQQLAVLDELEVRRRDDPSIEPFFDRSVEEPFFVKNLENIQGDERDAIFLSITYGKAPDGRIRYNFGPLNRDNGWRRLNVLVTRARRQMRVFASMRDHDINPAGAASDGPRLLREFLAYAEHRRLSGAVASVTADAESPFERDVAIELVRRGFRLQQQVGVCGYRIDIGVLDDEAAGRFLCGIECDGVAYHSMETVRDRDRLRQQELESRGWIIHRVWSTDWFKDRSGQIERLVSLIEASRTNLRILEEERTESRERAAPVQINAPASESGRPSRQSEDSAQPRRRPLATYTPFSDGGERAKGELLDADSDTLADIVTLIVEAEGPVHETDVTARVAGLWDTRAGSRIQAKIREAFKSAERKRRVTRRGPFLWKADGTFVPRSRAGSGIPGDRIAPEEYVGFVQHVLADGQAMARAELIAAVRSAAGFDRTGAILEQAIGSVIDGLLLGGQLGEASSGLVWRGAEES